MRLFLQSLCVLALLAGGLGTQAHENQANRNQVSGNLGAVYQRHRGGARPREQAGYGPGSFHYPGYPYYGNWNYLQPSYGYWFTRPYPSHFDYFRLRSRAPTEFSPAHDRLRASEPDAQ